MVLQNKLIIEYDSTLSLKDMETNIQNAYADRKKAKDTVECLSYEYRIELALVKEETGKMKAATFLCTANHIESQRRMYRNIRHM